MLQDFETWSKYEKINLVYSVRTESELAYVDRIQEIAQLLVRGILALNLSRLLRVIPMQPCMIVYRF
jgi:ferredoxin-NADP reductase